MLPRLTTALSDRYRIERELGQGGMATVYLAEDLKHHRQVAIKVLHQELAAALGAERFLREIETAASLRHPHILPLYDSGEANGFLFYVMPYSEGESLRNRLDREKQLALDVRTGALRWYHQMVPSDFHDRDLTQATPLIQVRRGGRDREALVTVGKEGVLRTLDRQTHERLYETPVTTRLNTDQPLTREGVRVCPGVLGGVEWNGPAYHPGTGLLFTPAVDWCTTFGLADSVPFVPGEEYMGGDVKLDSASQGWLTAVDASTGKVRWRYRSDRPMVAAVTTTAGGLVLTGENTGDFLALDAATGHVIYRFNTGGGMGGGIISYGVKGRQYIAAASGRSGFWFGQTGAPTLFVFALPSGGR